MSGACTEVSDAEQLVGNLIAKKANLGRPTPCSNAQFVSGSTWSVILGIAHQRPSRLGFEIETMFSANAPL